MSRPRYHARQFLNRKGFHAGAHIVAHVDDTSDLPDDGARHWVDATLTIADCGRTVTLDFDDIAGTAPARENALRKADILIDTITAFRDALAAEADLAARRHRRGRGR